MKTQANELSFKTYKSANVNHSDIILPEFDILTFPMDSDELVIEDFSNDSYGLSADIVALNLEKNNLYRSYTSDKDSKILDIKLSDDNKQLFDIHDIVCESGDEINVLVNYISEGDQEKFRSSMFRVYAKKNARVNLFIISMEGKEVENLESIYLKLDEEAQIKLYEYRLGSSKVTSNTKAELFGDKSNLLIDSIYFGYDDDKLDIDYDLIHYGKESKSDLMVNGALDGRATKLFKSTLDFISGSSKSDGSEEEYVILLSDDVHSQSVPVLLSGEDDVAGNHAASAGKLDMDMIFYLMSRGLSHSEAESLVISTRFASAIDALKDEKHKEMIWNKVKEIMG